MAEEGGFDRARMEEFAKKANNDIIGGYVAAMCSLGDALGLFRVLADKGPATSAELASRAEVDERYTREWLAALVCAGYLTYESADGRFTLPAEHAAVTNRNGNSHARAPRAPIERT